MNSTRLRDDAAAVHCLLADKARAGTTTVAYGEVARHVGRIANGLGPLLDEVEQMCARRGEPNLAVLVVNQTTREPTKYARRNNDWAAEQARCVRHHQTKLVKAC
jgi:hypothetical protein